MLEVSETLVKPNFQYSVVKVLGFTMYILDESLLKSINFLDIDTLSPSPFNPTYKTRLQISRNIGGIGYETG